MRAARNIFNSSIDERAEERLLRPPKDDSILIALLCGTTSAKFYMLGASVNL